MEEQVKMERILLYLFEEKSHHTVLNVTQRYLSIWGSWIHALVVIISLSILAGSPITCNDSNDFRLGPAYVTQSCTNQPLEIESDDGDVGVLDNDSTRQMADYHR